MPTSKKNGNSSLVNPLQGSHGTGSSKSRSPKNTATDLTRGKVEADLGFEGAHNVSRRKNQSSVRSGSAKNILKNEGVQ